MQHQYKLCFDWMLLLRDRHLTATGAIPVSQGQPAQLPQPHRQCSAGSQTAMGDEHAHAKSRLQTWPDTGITLPLQPHNPPSKGLPGAFCHVSQVQGLACDESFVGQLTLQG